MHPFLCGGAAGWAPLARRLLQPPPHPAAELLPRQLLACCPMCAPLSCLSHPDPCRYAVAQRLGDLMEEFEYDENPLGYMQEVSCIISVGELFW